MAIIFIVTREFLMFDEVFLPPHVKRCMMITYKYGIYELPYELRKDLRLTIFGN